MTLSEQDRSDFVGAFTRASIQAWSNDEFAAQLDADPKGALIEAGVDLPDDAVVQVDRRSPEAFPEDQAQNKSIDDQVRLYEEGLQSGTYVFLIPSVPQIDTEELSEEDLAGVAGGSCCCCSPCCCCGSL